MEPELGTKTEPEAQGVDIVTEPKDPSAGEMSNAFPSSKTLFNFKLSYSLCNSPVQILSVSFGISEKQLRASASNMGVLGTDYSLRPGHFLFFMMTACAVILGFNYLNEMNQRIQFQEDMVFMERQGQHIVAERSNIQRKASDLQRQLEITNKEMKRFKDMQKFQIQQQSEDFEREKKELLETISLKDDAIIEAKNQYESLQQRFQHLVSLMEQFQKNQSKLLEKFSTQSTQCMNVINMMSELCNKRIKFQTKPEFTKKNDLINGVTVQSVTKITETKDSSLVPHPEDTSNTNKKSEMERFLTLPTTDSPRFQTDDKQSSLNVKQELQASEYEDKSTTGTGDDQEDVRAQEEIYRTGEEKVMKSQKKKSQEGGNDDEITGINETEDIFLAPHPGDVFVTLLQSDDRQSSQKGKQAFQALGSEAKNIASTGNDQEVVTTQEKIYSPDEKKVLRSQKKEPQEGENDNDMASEKSVLKEILHITNNTAEGQKQTLQQLRKNNEKIPDSVQTLESSKSNQTQVGKANYSVDNSEGEVTAFKNQSLQQTNKINKATNRNIFVNKDVADETKVNTTLPEDQYPNEEIRGKTLKVNVKSQKSTPGKIETSVEDFKIEETETVWEENDKQDV
ncbi:uncharacterized protein LOC142150741 [Mixophyes fleayi]|uniref:uncharacterized protein LOC142150741 n=1 Tax=Mixophyes fleayi TaxID=3061075 RepID=UPI003F4DC84A